VADLNESFSSKLVKDQKQKKAGKERITTSISKHSKLNLASPNLTHYTCIILNTRSSTSKRGMALPSMNFYSNASIEIAGAFLKSQIINALIISSAYFEAYAL